VDAQRALPGSLLLHAFLKRMHARPSLQAVIQPILPILGKRWKEFD
jgi:hypothetical protein